MIKQIILLSAGIALGSSSWAGSISEQLNSTNSSNLMTRENVQQLAYYAGVKGKKRAGRSTKSMWSYQSNSGKKKGSGVGELSTPDYWVESKSPENQ